MLNSHRGPISAGVEARGRPVAGPRRLALPTALVAALSCALSFLPSTAHAVVIQNGDIVVNSFGHDIELIHAGVATHLLDTPGTHSGMAFDTAGNLYINNFDDNIYKYVPSTNTLTTLYTGPGGAREGLTFDSVTGHLFSADYSASRIDEVDLAGNLVRSITYPGILTPLGITARGGNLLVGDNVAGKVLIGTTTGSTFTTVGSLASAGAVEMDPAGNIYANSQGGSTVTKFTPDGHGGYTSSAFITGLTGAGNGLLRLADGRFVVTDFGGSAVNFYSSSGTLLNSIAVTNPDEIAVFNAAVPEPSSVVLMGVGGLGLAGATWRRRRSMARAAHATT